MASLNDIETKVHHIIDLLDARTTKTITGVLPLTLSAKGGTAADWVIYGNDENGTENEFDYTAAQMLNCYVSANGTVTYSSNDMGVIVPVQPSTTYTLVMTRFVKQEAAVDDAAAIATTTLPERGTQGRMLFYAISGDVSQTFTTRADEHFVYFKFCNTTKSYLDEQLQSIMLVRGSTAPDHHIPHQQGVGEQRVDGYYAPLTISQAGQPDKNYDIFIGDAPLTEGETVSKTSTGVDIELFDGENTISTTLYNKPEMTIKYKY